MQQEDDLRALAKIMDFGRAVSIFLLVIHVYVYCYPSFYHWNLTLEVVDRILLNFNRTTGIFNCILWSKLAVVLLLYHFLPGHDRCQRGKNYLERNQCGTLRRDGAVLSQLVAAGPLPPSRGGHGFVCLYSRCRLSLSVESGLVDEPSVPAPADGGPLQHRERELHAGNPADGKRVFRQPAYTFPLRGQDA